jgi:hypothetical protein
VFHSGLGGGMGAGKTLLARNAAHKGWECTEDLMKTTEDHQGRQGLLPSLPRPPLQAAPADSDPAWGGKEAPRPGIAERSAGTRGKSIYFPNKTEYRKPGLTEALNIFRLALNRRSGTPVARNLPGAIFLRMFRFSGALSLLTWDASSRNNTSGDQCN